MKTETAVASVSVDRETLGGKYLTFLLNGEEYALPILSVREIIKMMAITQIPQMPAHVKGVINLRGRVIPIIDLRSRFSLPPTEETNETCVIVVDRGTMTGLVVDAVREVHDFPKENIDPLPRMGASVDAEFIVGVGKVNGGIKILLDVDRLLACDDATLETLANA